ncbi:hypothetical protein PSEUDO8Z_150045 [Pseudomonas sp. 8Z]|nr:hypothetical protein PSEUDO8Z_150045 [Pseudomonas sp. 8Z]
MAPIHIYDCMYEALTQQVVFNGLLTGSNIHSTEVPLRDVPALCRYHRHRHPRAHFSSGLADGAWPPLQPRL